MSDVPYHALCEKQWPSMPWRKPLVTIVAGTGTSRLGCRFCIAQFGLKAAEMKTSGFLFDDPRDFEAHMKQSHPVFDG